MGGMRSDSPRVSTARVGGTRVWTVGTADTKRWGSIPATYRGCGTKRTRFTPALKGGILSLKEGKVMSNTLFNELAGCPFSLHKTQVDPLGTLGEAVGFGHRNLKL